jgi:NAD(P)-dependent dehydrogenase (short-subunit alcohol dehydrogenase family)
LTLSAPARCFAGKTVLVTGASRGIGKATAVAFAREGAHLILLARTQGGLEEADDEVRAAGGTATLITLDLADSARLDGLGPSLFQRFQHLDVLVANAAILGPLSPLTHVSDADWTSVQTINVTANWRLIRTLDPLLQRAVAGRAIFLSSNAARSCRAYWGPYAVSKAALEALVCVYAKEVASTPVRVNCLDPGATRTAMRAKAMPGENPESLPEPSAIAPIVLDMARADNTASGTVVRANEHALYPVTHRNA